MNSSNILFGQQNIIITSSPKTTTQLISVFEGRIFLLVSSQIMDEDESFSSSLEHSDNNNPMIVALDSSKKRKLCGEESNLLPLPKHFCLEQQASLPVSSCLSSNTESAEYCYTLEDTNTSNEASSSRSFTSNDSSCSGFATSSIDQYCSKATQEEDEDFTYMEFISPDSEFSIEDLSEVLNPVESTIKPTIDQEFENYFSSLMM